MALTDATTNDPCNFTLEYSKRSCYLYELYNVYNDDSDLPMQKYLLLIQNVRVLSHSENTMNVSITTKNKKTKRIYDFIMSLEQNIGKKLKLKVCNSNFSQTASAITICLYSKQMIIFDEENKEKQLSKIESGRMISIIMKLSQVSCEENIYTPIWSIVQVKLHRDIEKICMFDTDAPVKTPNAPVEKQTRTQQEILQDKHKPLAQSFIPTVKDIMSIRNNLRKIPATPEKNQPNIATISKSENEKTNSEKPKDTSTKKNKTQKELTKKPKT